MKGIQAPYLERLDHLRFYAAALVVLFHFFHSYAPDLRANNPLMSLIDEGHTGIGLFMVISGFVFTWIAREREVSYAPFLFSRFVRIYPLFTFAVFLLFWVASWIGSVSSGGWVADVASYPKFLPWNSAARIRSLRSPDVYKQKGIRYRGERLLKKVGKAAGK